MVFDEVLSSLANALVRFTSFAGLALLFGCVPIAHLVLKPAFAQVEKPTWDSGRDRVARRVESLMVAMLVASAAAALLALLFQAILVAEVQQTDVTFGSFKSVLATSFGRWHAVRLAVLVILAIFLVRRVRTALLTDSRQVRLLWAAWGALGLVLLATITFSGHASVATPTAVAIVNDVVHLAAGATWFTGIVMLAVVLPDAWIGIDPVARLTFLTPVVVRFSRVALGAITIVAITGTINSLLHVGALDDLATTGYGRALASKILLFFVVLVFGGLNHFVLRRRLEAAQAEAKPTSAHRTFRRTIAIELAVAIGLMGVTGVLVGMSRTKGREQAARAMVTTERF